MAKDGKEVKDKIGKDSTVSIMEVGPKELTLIGKNFGRGSEVIYQGFGFKHPETAQKTFLKKVGYQLHSRTLINTLVIIY